MSPEFLSSLAAFVSALSWPLAAVSIVILLRKEISKLLQRVQSLNVAGAAIQLNSLVQAEISDARESLAESKEGLEVQVQPSKLDETMRRMIETDPVNAVAFAWGQLQDVLVELATKKNIRIDLRSIRDSVNKLKKNDFISDEMADAIVSLYKTYKQVIHSYDLPLDEDALGDYVILTAQTREVITKSLRA